MITLQQAARVLGQLAGGDRRAHAAHQLGHEGQVVQREQALGGQLVRPHQVVEVAARVLAAGRARAGRVDRLAAAALGAAGEVEPPAPLRVVHERRAVARQAGGRGAVEGVEPGGHRVHEVVHVADPEQVARRRVGQAAQRPAHHLAHLLLGLAQRAADRDPVRAGAGHVGRGLRAQVLVHATLHDPVHQLVRRPVLGVPAQAALEPAMRALHRARRVVALHVEGRALVEGQGDVRAQLGLHGHRGLGAHEALGAVEVGAKAHALLLDRDDHRARAVAAPLDLLRHRAVAHREDLVAAGVGDDRPPPAHELVQAAHLGHELLARLDEQVERVAQHHVEAERGHLGRVQRLDRGRGGQRHEGRRAHVAVRGVDHARARGAVAGFDAEGSATHPASLGRARV